MKRLDELAASILAWPASRENLKPADLALQEASYALRDYLSRLEANPGAAGRDRDRAWPRSIS